MRWNVNEYFFCPFPFGDFQYFRIDEKSDIEFHPIDAPSDWANKQNDPN